MKSLKSKPPWSEFESRSKTWSDDAAAGDSLQTAVLPAPPVFPAAYSLQPEAFPASMIAAKPGKLVVISGPSGVGKSTVVREVLQRLGPAIRLSVSATTRPPRPGERDGVDYYFLTDAEFRRRRDEGEFLECIEVFGRGHWYGTLWSEVRSSLSQGKWVILEIDVDGAGEVLRQFPEAVTIFIRPESVEELERRLRSRGT
jgi:guanylate kinase